MTDSALKYSPPAASRLEVVFEDEALLVVDKPAGLLTVPGRGPDKADCLVARVQQQYDNAKVVHRLDMETSGLVVFARNIETQRAIGRLFESRRIRKTYIAIVDGRPTHDSGEINAPLIADWPNRPKQKVDFEVGKPSRTLFRVISFDPETGRSRLQLNPVTGRSHQLRVHLLSIGHPIVGDALYGPPWPEAGRLLLHAETLEFEHPMTHRSLHVSRQAPF